MIWFTSKPSVEDVSAAVRLSSPSALGALERRRARARARMIGVFTVVDSVLFGRL